MKTQTETSYRSDRYLINWVGGKRLLRKKIAELIPENIGSYIEPFGGGAWVLFYKDKWANLEVYNDLDNDLYNLFTVTKYHAEELTKELKFLANSRKIFVQILKSEPLTDIQRAAKFFFLIQRSYGAKGSHFATARNGLASSGKSQARMLERIFSISQRCDKVYIENLSYEDLIPRYDCESAFFYVDPPYVKGADLYKTVEKTFDHKKLYEILKKTKGRWLLSYDDEPNIRELYKDYSIIETNRVCSLSSIKGQNYKELLIKNY